MLGAVAAIAAAIAILIVSDGQPTSKWSVQPAVYLAIASALTNIFIYFAFGRAVTVAWWKRATQANTTLGDLHRCWSYRDSLWEAILAGRNVNLIAVASILVAVLPINGPFLQRASRVHLGRFEAVSDVKVQIAQVLPDGYSAFISGRGHSPSLLTPEFRKIVESAANQAPINVTTTGCTGECSTTLRGAGFAINCSADTSPFDLNPVNPKQGENFDTSQAAMKNGTKAFGASFRWSESEPGTLNVSVQFKDTTKCDGNLQIRNCTLRTAVVEYPVAIDGNKSAIELRSGTTLFDDRVVNMTETRRESYLGQSTLGGFYTALQNTYESMANLRFVGAVGYELITDGATANRYALVDMTTGQSGGFGPQSNCTLSFKDPTNDLIRAARDLMFRSALAAGNSTNSQTVSAQEISRIPIYESRYLYLGLATLFTALAWLATFPIFLGWWHVGRTVSLSPIETAKAFRAPMLQNADPNAKADDLVKQVGQRPVRYGVVTADDGQQELLEMNDPWFVTEPGRGRTFAG